jgi:hypothetical protein
VAAPRSSPPTSRSSSSNKATCVWRVGAVQAAKLGSWWLDGRAVACARDHASLYSTPAPHLSCVPGWCHPCAPRRICRVAIGCRGPDGMAWVATGSWSCIGRAPVPVAHKQRTAHDIRYHTRPCTHLSCSHAHSHTRARHVSRPRVASRALVPPHFTTSLCESFFRLLSNFSFVHKHSGSPNSLLLLGGLAILLLHSTRSGEKALCG